MVKSQKVGRGFPDAPMAPHCLWGATTPARLKPSHSQGEGGGVAAG